MIDVLTNHLYSQIFRVLELNPSIEHSEAIDGILKLAKDYSNTKHEERVLRTSLEHFMTSLNCRSVVNPNVLQNTFKSRFHFFLVNAQPGWLFRLAEQHQKSKVGISDYVIYGVWDSLLLLSGTNQEAKRLLEIINKTIFNDLANFTVSNVHLFHRYRVSNSVDRKKKLDHNKLNLLINNYNHDGLSKEREAYIKDNILLGPVWDFNNSPSFRVNAFCGIKLVGGSHGESPDAILDSLLSNDLLRTCLLHFFEVDRGFPFHFMAKLCCKDMKELDMATDAISSRVGRIVLEGSTFVVASGKSEIPLIGTHMKYGESPSVDLRYFESIAGIITRELGEDAIKLFNELDSSTQLLVLKTIDDLFSRLDNECWGESVSDKLLSAVKDYVLVVLNRPRRSRLTGPAMQLATAVEETVKHVLRAVVESVYGKKYAKAQNELKLRHKNYLDISLGDAVNAFKVINSHADFETVSTLIDDEWITRLVNFNRIRNTWAHSGKYKTFDINTIIDDSRRFFIEGIDIIRWMRCEVLKVVKETKYVETEEVLIDLPDKPKGHRPSGLFISYSHKDSDISKRIAIVLGGFGYNVWFDGWEIRPGDSIIEKVNDGLARNDTLLVLLSPNSVNSKWVKKELNTALMDQLKGHNVKIIPIIIDHCEIPRMLSEISYINLAEMGFEGAIIKLITALKKGQ